jgi:hypothetical protein
MLNGSEMAAHTAQAIAGNRAGEVGQTVTLSMIAYTVLFLFLVFATPLNMFSAFVIATASVTILLVPLLTIRMLRRKSNLAKLRQMQLDQLEEHRETV